MTDIWTIEAREREILQIIRRNPKLGFNQMVAETQVPPTRLRRILRKYEVTLVRTKPGPRGSDKNPIPVHAMQIATTILQREIAAARAEHPWYDNQRRAWRA